MSAADATLVHGVLNGDRAAFADLYDRWGRLVRAICFDETRCRDRAADLAQDVFLRAFEGLSGLDDPQRFGAWIVGIARRTCRECRRRQRREAARLRALPIPSRADPDVVDSSPACVQSLRAAVASLPEGERLALHAFYLQGLNIEQARGTLGLSRSGFYRLLACARRRLAHRMARQGVCP